MHHASGAFSLILLLHHRIPFTVTIQVHYFCSYMKMLKFCWNSQSSYKYSRIYQILFYMRNMLSNLFLSRIRQVLRKNTGIWDHKSTYNISLRFLKIIAVRFTKQVCGIRHCIIMEESIQVFIATWKLNRFFQNFFCQWWKHRFVCKKSHNTNFKILPLPK